MQPPLPSDKDIKDDHSVFKLVKGVARIPTIGESNQNDKKRHSAIAHLLAKYASRSPDAPIEFTSVPSHDELEHSYDHYDVWLIEKGYFQPAKDLI